MRCMLYLLPFTMFSLSYHRYRLMHSRTPPFNKPFDRPFDRPFDKPFDKLRDRSGTEAAPTKKILDN